MNLSPGYDMLLFEGHTRPAMKQAVGISKGSGVYSCSLLLSKSTKKIIAAKDRSCAAGKRGFCKGEGRCLFLICITRPWIPELTNYCPVGVTGMAICSG